MFSSQEQLDIDNTFIKWYNLSMIDTVSIDRTWKCSVCKQLI